MPVGAGQGSSAFVYMFDFVVRRDKRNRKNIPRFQERSAVK
ncbi:hypothetical protein ACQCVP_11720 [Rossellomorea vietnamensis]